MSSLATDKVHRVEPLPLEREPAVTLAALQRIVEALPRARLLTATPQSLHFQITTRVFRFRDDLELQVVPAAGLVHVRSASRVGYSDFGVNRRRVARVRAAYMAWLRGRASDRDGLS